MNFRKYGKAPFRAAVVHGGPGAAGSVKPLAEEFSSICGVLEPLQTKMSVDGQIEELKKTLEENAELPVILVGHSWGAMLIYMFAAKYHHMVEKIILVGSGSFEEKYYPDLNKNREERLTDDERVELKRLRQSFSDPSINNKDEIFLRFGKLMGKLDSYEPIEMNVDVDCSYEIFRNVWPEVHGMRKSGELYEMGKNIKCEVTAIHGDYDSHPSEGIRESLSKIIKDFKFYAKDEFYEILKSEIKHHK